MSTAHSVELKHCDIVLAYDPGRTRETQYKTNARSAMMCTACTPQYEVLVLGYFAARTSLDVLYQKLKELVQLFRPRCIGIEDVATQIVFGDAFQILADNDPERVALPAIESLRPDTTVTKIFRIKTQIQRLAPYGKLFFQDHFYELRSEYTSFPRGRTIDLLDCLAYCIGMHNIPDKQFSRNYNQEMKKRYALSQQNVIDLYDQNGTYMPREDYWQQEKFRPKSPPRGLVANPFHSFTQVR